MATKTNACTPLVDDNETPRGKNIVSGFASMRSILGHNFRRSLYVLLLLSICNIFVQMDIFLIGVTSNEMQLEQNWGEGDGTGFEFDLIAGPIFALPHILGALFLGYIIENDCCCASHKAFLSIFMLIVSSSVVYTGYSNHYYELIISRIILAIFTSIASTLSVSIITDYFPPSIRSSACALWNFSIYIGLSGAYGGGNAISEYFKDWRYTWWILGYIGIVLAILIMFLPKYKHQIVAATTTTSSFYSMTNNTTNTGDNNRESVDHADADNSDIDIDEDRSQVELISDYPIQPLTPGAVAVPVPLAKSKHSQQCLQQRQCAMYGTIVSLSHPDGHPDGHPYAFDHTKTRNDTATTIDTNIYDIDADNNLRNNHQQIVAAMKQQHITMIKVLVYIIKSPSLLLLIVASLYRNCGVYIWCYQADNWFVNEKNDSNYKIAAYLSWIPMIGGCCGCFLGGFISDKLSVYHMIHAHGGTGGDDAYRDKLIDTTVLRRIYVLIISNLLSFPFAAGVIRLSSPYCYFSLFIMYIFSEIWIMVVIALIIEFIPPSMRTQLLSIYYFIIGLSSFSPILVTSIQDLFDNNGYYWSIFILFPCIYGSSAFIFFCVLFTYKRDLSRKQRHTFFGSSRY